jgi:hypothetical protein
MPVAKKNLGAKKSPFSFTPGVFGSTKTLSKSNQRPKISDRSYKLSAL